MDYTKNHFFLDQFAGIWAVSFPTTAKATIQQYLDAFRDHIHECQGMALPTSCNCNAVIIIDTLVLLFNNMLNYNIWKVGVIISTVYCICDS